jgi:hypothetical protein
MRGTTETLDERMNELIDELTGITGETPVAAICEALEQRRDHLIAPRPGRVLHFSLELVREGPATRRGE